MYVKKEKCEFAQTEIKFLGHLISKSEIRMDGAKVAAIRDWPALTKVTELRSFLGLANYYRRFIMGYSKIASALTELLKKRGSGNETQSAKLPSKSSKMRSPQSQF